MLSKMSRLFDMISLEDNRMLNQSKKIFYSTTCLVVDAYNFRVRKKGRDEIKYTVVEYDLINCIVTFP